jgi:putative membrane protein
MIHLLITWVVITIAILITAYFLPGIRVRSVGTAFIGAAVLGVLNVLVKPILTFLAIPLIVLTLGLFLIVINAVMLMIVGAIVPGFEVRSFWTALGGAIIMSIVTYLMTQVVF